MLYTRIYILYVRILWKRANHQSYKFTVKDSNRTEQSELCASYLKV